MPTATRKRIIVIATAFFALVVFACATWKALAAMGTPFPGIFFDPYASYSNVGLGSWGTSDLGLRFPDRILEVNGDAVSVTSNAGLLGEDVRERIGAAASIGQTRITVLIECGARALSFELPILRLGWAELLVFYVNYVACAVLHILFALVVFSFSEHRNQAHAYLTLSVGAFGFLTSFFDYHVTATLTPVFLLSETLLVAGLLGTAYFFPSASPAHTKPSSTLNAGIVLAVVVAAVMTVAPHAGIDVQAGRMLLTFAIPLSLLVLAASLCIKWFRSRDGARDQLRVTAVGLVVAPIAAGLGFPATLALGGDLLHMVLPVASLAMTASLGLGLVRHNVMATSMIIRQRLLLVPVGVIAVYVGSALWLTTTNYSMPFGYRLFLAGVSGAAFAALTYEVGRRVLFRSLIVFRPALTSLSAELASKRNVDDVEKRISESLAGALGLSAVDILPVNATDRLNLSEDSRTKLAEQGHAWTDDPALRRKLVLSLEAYGEKLGIVVMYPKVGSALLTSEDLALAETVVTFGGIAVQSVRAAREADSLRSLGTMAAEQDKEHSINTIAAELAHEIAYPLSYFRFLLGRSGPDKALTPEDVDIGREELERLERMLRNLRRYRARQAALVQTRVLEIAKRAIWLVRADVRRPVASWQLESTSDPSVLADPDQLLQLLANLVRNAADAAGAGGIVGVRLVHVQRGVRVDVTDSGPGVGDDLATAMFSPWVTTRPQGTGLGLPICQRIVQGFGWRLTYSKDPVSTFSIHIPESAMSERLQAE